MAMRPTSFDLHIKLMFTTTDVDHMKGRGLDLSNYEEVKSHADDIVARLNDEVSPMPPTDNGGPWPEEWISLFERWVEEGCHA